MTLNTPMSTPGSLRRRDAAYSAAPGMAAPARQAGEALERDWLWGEGESYMDEFWKALSTFAWVGLIGGIVWRYHEHFVRLLSAIAGRIEDGDTIKAGPLQFTPQIKTPTKEQEEKKAEEALISASPAAAELQLPPATISARENNDQMSDGARLILDHIKKVTDAALSYVDDKWGVIMRRDASVGGYAYDGYFTKNGNYYAVDVIYISRRNGNYAQKSILSRLKSAASSLSATQLRNHHLLLLVISDEGLPSEKQRDEICDVIARSQDSIRTTVIELLRDALSPYLPPNLPTLDSLMDAALQVEQG